MRSLKAVGFLSFLLIFQPTLVRSESLERSESKVRSESISLAQAVTCLQVVAKGVAELCSKILPLANDLFKCVNYVTVEDLHDLDTLRFRKVASGFITKLVEGPSCLETFGDALMEIIKPYYKAYTTIKCAYVGVPPRCVPAS